MLILASASPSIDRRTLARKEPCQQARGTMPFGEYLVAADRQGCCLQKEEDRGIRRPKVIRGVSRNGGKQPAHQLDR